MPADQLTFTSVTQSLSQSSEEFAEVFSKQFSLFKTSSSGGEQGITFETRDDGETEAFRSYRNSAEFGPRVTSPSHRTSQLLDVIGANSHQLSSPLHSIASNSSEESWDGSQTMGSREFSLLDAIPSGDEGDEDTDGESATYFDDGESNFGDADTAAYFGDGRSPDSQDSPRFDEFPEEDGMTAFGGVLLQIGSCNFKEELEGLTFDEDDYSVLSDAFRNQRENLNSMRQSIGMAKKNGPPPTLQEDTPKKRSIFDAMFSCHG
jgi:hypothetical protein